MKAVWIMLTVAMVATTSLSYGVCSCDKKKKSGNEEVKTDVVKAETPQEEVAS